MRIHRHPANQARHDDRTAGQRVADVVTKGFGSWRYLIIQTVIVIAWIIVNVVAFVAHWDPYPFILLNLVFSTQASYAAPIILLAQNRQEEHDRMRAEVDYEHNTEALTRVTDMQAALGILCADLSVLQTDVDRLKNETVDGPNGGAGAD